MEPLLSGGSGGAGVLADAAAAAKQHLHEGAYSAAEIEAIIGLPLEELYADNEHSKRCESSGLQP